MTPQTRFRRSALRTGAAVLAATSLVAACGSDETTSNQDTTSTTAEAPASVIEISGAWARTSPMMASRGAVYLTIANAGDLDDALLSASVDPAIAGSVEVHETVPAAEATETTAMGGDMSTETTAMGGDMSTQTTAMGGDMPASEMMTMQEVDRIPVPAGGSVALEPGGYHIMLMDLVAPLEVGTTLTVTLTFEEAGEVVVTAEVRDTAP